MKVFFFQVVEKLFEIWAAGDAKGSDASEEGCLSVLDEPPIDDSLAPMDAALKSRYHNLESNSVVHTEDHLLGVNLRCHLRALQVHGGDPVRQGLGLVSLVLSHQALSLCPP